MSYFMQNGDAYVPTPGRDSFLKALPVGNYVVAKSMMGMFFQRVASFDDPGKTYGNLDARAERILNTFLDRPRSTGALFAGEKGSGKSLLARVISHKAYDMGIPTILVNAPWVGDEFSALLATIEQPAIIQMDEFEKVYGREHQEGVLTLLDGTMTSKKLFILTVNDKYRVDTHMRNRPGRLFYSLDFSHLEAEFVREYCADNLKMVEHLEQVVKISTMFEAFNFDMLKALVEEMNRYGEDPFDALDMLNAKPVNNDPVDAQYDVTVWDADGKIKVGYPNTVNINPLAARGGGLNIMLYEKTPTKDDPDDETEITLMCGPANLSKLDAAQGIFEFTHEKGYRILFERQRVSGYNLRTLL